MQSKEQKISILLKSQPPGVVFLTAWLVKNGYSNQLINRYKKSGWLHSIGSGVLIRNGDAIGYEGAIFALQNQSQLQIHPGGKTALSLLGKSHYLQFSQNNAVLFGAATEKLPKWFTNYRWGVEINYHSTSFISSQQGFVAFDFGVIKIKISGAARAFMECLYLVPKKQEFIECYEIMEGLNNLRPKLVQELLENCGSVKVKRLFLFMAEKANHRWFHLLDLSKIELGSGKRSIIKKGKYIPKYKITAPLELI